MASPLCGQEHGLIDSFRVIRASPFSSTVLHVVDSPRIPGVRLTIMVGHCRRVAHHLPYRCQTVNPIMMMLAFYIASADVFILHCYKIFLQLFCIFFKPSCFCVVVPGYLLQAFFGVLSHGLIGFDLLNSCQSYPFNQSFSVSKDVSG